LKIGLDTSFIVPLIAEPSEFHDRTWAAFQELREGGAEFVVTGHALLEAFSVLTRSPEPIKTLPREAERSLRDIFSNAIMTRFDQDDAWTAIAHTISRGYHGGRIYDAVIALATFEAGARVLLTWNVKHFLTIAPFGLEIREP